MTTPITNKAYSEYNRYPTNLNYPEGSVAQVKHRMFFNSAEQPSQKKRKFDHFDSNNMTKPLSKIDLICYETFDDEKKKESLIPEVHSTAPVNNSQDPLFNINALTITELTHALQSDLELNPLERFQKFCNLFTFIPSTSPSEKEYRHLFLEIPKGHFFPEQQKCSLNLMIVQDTYDSQCFAEKELNLNTADITYFYINASLWEDEDILCFQIRLDSWALTSEILHIQRLSEISGTHSKNLCMAILNYLNPPYIYLNDDSKITFNSEEIINLRLLLPVVSDSPKTWYTPDGFKLFSFVQLESPLSQITLDGQNKDDYVRAVNKIRGTSLSSLLTRENQPKLTLWKRRYIKDYHKKIPTVYSLGKAIYETSRNHAKLADIRAQEQASLDLPKFYNAFLTIHSSFPREYTNALSILYNYKIWYRQETQMTDH
jgi:hypothetical protein